MKLVNQLFRLCENLSKSQGFYGRLLEELHEKTDDELIDINKLMEEELGTAPTDLDIILWLEG